MALSDKEKELFEAYKQLPKDDIEAHYRFLIKHDADLGQLTMLWEGITMMCSHEERQRIEEKLDVEGLL